MDERDTDFLVWTEQQAAALRTLARTRQFSNELDLEQVAEEIEDMGRSELNAVRSYIRQILVHIIKAASPPESETLFRWQEEVLTFHANLLDLIAPSMLSRVEIQPLWRRAIKEAGKAFALHGQVILPSLPQACPFGVADFADPEFDFAKAVKKVQERIGPPSN